MPEAQLVAARVLVNQVQEINEVLLGIRIMEQTEVVVVTDHSL